MIQPPSRKLLGAVMLTIVLGICAGYGTAPQVESFEEFQRRYTPSDFLVRDRHGEPLQLSRVSFTVRALHWVNAGDLPQVFKEQLVAAEDSRFALHSGVDWRALARAVYQTITTGKLQGGSTISMQLSSLMRGDGWRRGVWSKLQQIRAARALERRWSKQQILEGYSNLVWFRGEFQGIAAAARGLFGKYPDGLSPAEGALLAALVRSPNASPDKVAVRACDVLTKTGYAEQCEEARRLSARMQARPALIPEIAAAPFVAKTLEGLYPGQHEVTSTIDAALQYRVSEILRNHLKPLAVQNVRDGAVLVADNQSGEIRAYVGNSGETATARYVDGVRARRSAGSTLKPFLYAAALDARLLTAGSTLDDAP
ncbi:MAG: penicillin-binding protein 1C, partial [Proteobacteria bacterium]|nr:penicillin-binding protein 1C [Pseudomonadota bacterium]